ncbi:mechanosensitive ion channel family protein [Microbacterium gorillae]|uniref:mechanosensitive ion channel family protein n=1 Tax=Microbacterium gorillae TaxID=1231063 RepID=UPI000693B793|nr:mechanosensitive ion channel domain-containing protein [Microbacterium gorillae]
MLLTATSPLPDWTPPSWDSVLRFLLQTGLNLLSVASIIVICFLIAGGLRFVIRRIVNRIVLGAKHKANVEDTQALDRSPLAAARLVQRTRTLGSILQNVVNITLVIVAGVLSVQVLNQDILGSLTLITAAVGAGLGFGAQNIVKDVLNGIFIVVEDQVGIGDVVDLGLATGIVEYVSVRVTHVRDVNGTLWYVRNGEILRIGNMSQGWSRVIVDVSVPAAADVDAADAVLQGALTSFAQDPKWRSRIVGKPETWGLEAVTDDTMVLRAVMRTRSTSRDDVAQELRTRLKRAFQATDMPVANLISVELTGSEGAFRVRGANPPRTATQPVVSTPKRPTWRARTVAGPTAIPVTPEDDARPVTKPSPTGQKTPKKKNKPESGEKDQS